MKTALFDYGAGNLHSLGKALEGGGADVSVTTDWDEALSAEVLVLPGVGSFGAAVRALGDHGDVVREALRNGLPCLGICLGMQLFFEESEEGEGRGIGLIPGRVRKMEARRVPQMGWNDVETGEDPLFRDVEGLVAYYANSFVCEPEDDECVTAISEYDGTDFVAGVRTDTLSLLKDISNGVAAQVVYEERNDEAAQTPVETLARGRGSCRDFAVLFVDAVRSLGFGARIVSGYLYDPDRDAVGSAGAGSTHAWAEVYVPGAGWIMFDPTNRSVGGFNLIPVAVARHIRQTMPVSGSFVGDAAAFETLDVKVTVDRASE